MSEHTIKPLPSVNWKDGKPYSYCPECGRTEKDDRLIAAAPDMLSALLDFIDAVDRHCIELNSQDVDIGEGRQPFPWHEAWIHDARAAIAKATGGE